LSSLNEVKDLLFLYEFQIHALVLRHDPLSRLAVSKEVLVPLGRALLSRQILRSFVFLWLALVNMPALGAQESKPKVSDAPMTSEQLAIYRIVLNGWMDNRKHPVHLSIQTAALAELTEDDMDADCAKGLDMETGYPNEIHRFRPADLPQLGSARIELVDPEKQAAEVRENDPGKHIREGSKIGNAVSNGFAHGLVTLGEIRFDKSHTHAILWYGFTCGALCGNGGTVLLEKKKGMWGIKSHCSNWVS
jgi:hypothetical protein